MALNIKKLENMQHPDIIDHVHEDKIGSGYQEGPIDSDKDFREDRPKDHNLVFEKNLLKINVISK